MVRGTGLADKPGMYVAVRPKPSLPGGTSALWGGTLLGGISNHCCFPTSSHIPLYVLWINRNKKGVFVSSSFGEWLMVVQITLPASKQKGCSTTGWVHNELFTSCFLSFQEFAVKPGARDGACEMCNQPHGRSLSLQGCLQACKDCLLGMQSILVTGTWFVSGPSWCLTASGPWMCFLSSLDACWKPENLIYRSARCPQLWETLVRVMPWKCREGHGASSPDHFGLGAFCLSLCNWWLFAASPLHAPVLKAGIVTGLHSLGCSWSRCFHITGALSCIGKVLWRKAHDKKIQFLSPALRKMVLSSG